MSCRGVSLRLQSCLDMGSDRAVNQKGHEEHECSCDMSSTCKCFIISSAWKCLGAACVRNWIIHKGFIKTSECTETENKQMH